MRHQMNERESARRTLRRLQYQDNKRSARRSLRHQPLRTRLRMHGGVSGINDMTILQTTPTMEESPRWIEVQCAEGPPALTTRSNRLVFTDAPHYNERSEESPATTRERYAVGFHRYSNKRMNGGLSSTTSYGGVTGPCHNKTTWRTLRWHQQDTMSTRMVSPVQ
jgi:hypothetical protein